MEIPYNKKSQKWLLGYSIVTLALGIAARITDSSGPYTGFVLGFGSLAIYLYRHFTPYAVVTDTKITKGKWFATTIDINDKTHFRMFAGDIKITSDGKTITLDKNAMDKSVLPAVEEHFRQIILT